MNKKITAILIVGALFFSPLMLTVQAQKQIESESKSGDAEISDNVKQQIAAILAEKKNRLAQRQAGGVTLPADKLSSSVRAAVRQERGESAAPGTRSLAYRAERNEKGDVALDIRGEVTKELLAEIEQNGGKVFFASAKDRFVQAFIPLWAVEFVAANDGVKQIEFARKGLTNGSASAAASQNLWSPLTGKNIFDESILLRGSVNTQGDATHRAAQARSTFGVTGAGVKIGVISDSVRFLERSQASGDLPNVTVIPGQSGILPNGGDIGEGTAMLEIIADIAPGAQLLFATGFENGFQNPVTFANNIRALRNAGCTIIVDDLVATFGAEGTPFQESVISQAINDVSASGVVYLSAAGNAGNKNDGTSGTWEGDFRPSGRFLTVDGENLGEIHDFVGFGSGLSNTVTGTAFGFYLLWWADSIGGATTDYDLFLISSDGTQIIASSENTQDGQGGDDFPVEGFAVQDAIGLKVVITNFNNSPRRALHLVNERGRLIFNTAGTIRGHNAAANALSIAATPAGPFKFTNDSPSGPFPNAFNSSNKVEIFSTDGPRRVFFNPNGTAVTPNNFLFSTGGGRLLNKVDLTGADGVSTTFPGNSGLNPFFGTSAAAPHIAAIAALVKSAKPRLTRTQIISILNSSSIDIEASGRDRDAGAGIVDAFRAVQAARQ